MFTVFCLFVLIFVSSCNSSTSDVSENITRHFQSSGRTFVTLTEVVPGKWEKVCVFGPRSDNKAAKKLLGFDWDLESKTSIASNDKIALLLFVKGQEVVETVEHPRRDGDFANLSRQCIAREKASFNHETNPKKEWPGLFPKKG